MDTESISRSRTVLDAQQPLHRACVSCARAKVKCVPGNESGKCERCNRLKKVCEPVIGPRRKPQKPSRITKHHVEKLEEKLDDLVTLLKSSQDPGPNKKLAPEASQVVLPLQGRAQHEPEHQQILKSTPPLQASPLCSHDCSSSTSRTTAEAPTISQYGGTSGTSNVLNSSGPRSYETASHEADYLLDKFRDNMATYFPFVVVPQTMTAKQLQEQRPYLYNAILAVSNRDPTLQRALGKSVMKELAERVIVGGERNLDLLLGVLTYAGWCYYHFYSVVTLTSLLSAAQTLIYDLALNRPPMKEFPGGMVKAAIRKTSLYHSMVSHVRTSEERRALLGCFFLTSVTSLFFHRIDSMRLSPYIEECCTALLEAQELEEDSIAVSLVQLQVVVERLRQSPWYSSPEPLGSSIPPVSYIRSVEKQLQNLRNAWPPNVEQNGVLLMKFYNTQAYVYEIGLSQTPALASLPNHDFQRLEHLHNCLQAVKNYFDTFFTMALSNFNWFSVPVYTQLTGCIMTLERLSNFQHPDWDLSYVRETVNFFSVMDKMIEVFDAGRKQAGSDESSIFHHSWIKAQAIKAYCESRMVKVPISSEPPSTEPTGELDPDLTMSGLSLEYINSESWLRDVWGQFDYPLNFEDPPNY